jgi:hypothetical protein
MLPGRRTAALVALTALALPAAGCGGRNAAGVASVASSTTTTTASANPAVAYSQCMRAHGIQGFPDPGSDGSIDKQAIVALAVPKQKMQAAGDACAHFLPNGGAAPPAQQTRTELADELSFARCMRSHGVPNFPDPTAQDGLSVALVEAHGVDVHSTAVLHTVQTCLPASHGALTAAKVREALQNAGH